MIERDRSRIEPRLALGGKFGMVSVEVIDMRNEFRRAAAEQVQVAVALRATHVRNFGQHQRAGVLAVAVGAFRSKSLVGVVRWGLMAIQAGRIRNVLAEAGDLRMGFAYVAGGALLAENGMSRGERPPLYATSCPRSPCPASHASAIMG